MAKCFEHNYIDVNDLPVNWRGETNLNAFENFLQSNWEQREALYRDSEPSKTQRFLELDHRKGIKARNYIGTVVFKGERLDIFPKAYEGSDDDEITVENLISDLTFWLHYCDSAKYPFISMPSSFDNAADTYEIFVAIYLQYVEELIKNQFFLSYEDVRETGSSVKGKIDFADYIANKYPTGNKHLVDYVYSGFVSDNKVNQIIKATCLMINRRTKSQRSSAMLRTILSQLQDVTDRVCSPSECETAIIPNTRSGYRVVMQMSKMFLMNKSASGIQGQLDSFCFLFPAELLFEGFIGGIVKETYLNKANVTLQSRNHYFAEAYLNDVLIGNAFLLKEDIIIDAGEGSTTVLDTKYKHIGKLADAIETLKMYISDSDIRQIAIYAMENDAMDGYLIYPLRRNEAPDENKLYYVVNERHEDYNFSVRLHILRVPFTFSEDFEGRKECLIKLIREIMEDYFKTIDSILMQ